MSNKAYSICKSTSRWPGSSWSNFTFILSSIYSMFIFVRYSLPTSKFNFFDEIRYVLTENWLGEISDAGSKFLSFPLIIVHDFDRNTDFYFFGGDSSFFSDYFVDYSMISFGTFIIRNSFYFTFSFVFLTSIFYISNFFS